MHRQLQISKVSITCHDLGKAIFFDLKIGTAKSKPSLAWLTDDLKLKSPSESNMRDWNELSEDEVAEVRARLEEHLEMLLGPLRNETRVEAKPVRDHLTIEAMPHLSKVRREIRYLGREFDYLQTMLMSPSTVCVDRYQLAGEQIKGVEAAMSFLLNRIQHNDYLDDVGSVPHE
ncbi:hypothetical protein GR138_05595 [Shinella kummerowiae]|uniref:Uncharacterized protein n=1 Tax=Shinella kummerowiae TaxID=417745 RepID=A0A6N8S7F3_9HYPH|nr:hypothetical protein [Shinella kummerowiae]MXN44653.1 hypothetical protein [Shinella kummerowiae]